MAAAIVKAGTHVALATDAVLSNTPNAVHTTNAAHPLIQCAVLIVAAVLLPAAVQDVVHIQAQCAVTDNTVANTETIVARLAAAVRVGRDRLAVFVFVLSIPSCSSL